jgi:hypothetical protein
VKKRFAIFVFLLTLARVSLVAHAEAQQIRDCDFKLKNGCFSGDARVTLANGAVTRLEVDIVWCNRQRGAPGYTCTIDSSRGDGASTWSEDGDATLIANGSPFNSDQPDRVKVTVGRDVTIDLNEAQSAGSCGAGAELPLTIVIPAQGQACRVRLREP